MRQRAPLVLLLLAACGAPPAVPEGRAERRPEIVETVREIAEPVARIGRAATTLERRVAVMEGERKQLQREAAEWEQEMARWQERGLTAEQQLEMALAELRKVRANWFAQLDEATSGLRAELDELQSAHDDLSSKYQLALVESARHDQQAAQDDALIRGQGERIRSLNSEVSSQASTIASLETKYRLTFWIAVAAGVYVLGRLLKLTPQGRAYLFWLP